MADSKLLEDNDDEIEVVEVEQLPEPGKEPEKKDDESDDDEIDDGEDARLVESDDDEDEPAKGSEDSATRKRRLKRREAQKAARDRLQNDLVSVRSENAELARRLAAVEGRTHAIDESSIDTRIDQVNNDIRLADQILAKAIEAGNGEDAATALRLRDEAKDAKFALERDKSSFTQARNAPKVDPNVALHSREWIESNNGWYGKDPVATDTAKRIDSQVAADGYNPATPAYWQELTRRLNETFGAAETARNPKIATERKRPPPQGQSREHAPQTTRTEVYVTPERKQAMIDAGKWDDPKERTKMLKAYAAYDREQSANR